MTYMYFKHYFGMPEALAAQIKVKILRTNIAAGIPRIDRAEFKNIRLQGCLLLFSVDLRTRRIWRLIGHNKYKRISRNVW